MALLGFSIKIPLSGEPRLSLLGRLSFLSTTGWLFRGWSPTLDIGMVTLLAGEFTGSSACLTVLTGKLSFSLAGSWVGIRGLFFGLDSLTAILIGLGLFPLVETRFFMDSSVVFGPDFRIEGFVEAGALAGTSLVLGLAFAFVFVSDF